MLENILNLTDKIGIAGTLTLLLFCGLIYIIFKFIMSKIDTNKKENEEIRDYNEIIEKKIHYLQNNPFFSDIDQIKKVKINIFKFKTEFEKNISIDILNNLIDSDEKSFKDFIDSFQPNMNELEFQKVIKNITSNSYSNFINKCKLDGIPQIIIDNFLLYYSPIFKLKITLTNTIASSTIHDLIIDKLNCILEINSAMLKEIANNMDMFINTIGDDMNGLSYKNHTQI